MRSGDDRVAVIGAGVVGSTVAMELARRDVDVTLFDAGQVAAGSSGRAAGICYDAFAGRIDAEIAADSLATFRDRGAMVDSPYVWLAREGDDRNAEAIAEQVPRMRERGRDVAFLDADELAERWSALRTDDVAVAAVARDAGLVDPGIYTRETAQFAVAAGANLRTETPVRLDEDTGVVGEPVVAGAESFGTVVVAAGAHTGRLMAAADLPVAIEPYRVQAFLTAETELAASVPTQYDATGSYYLRPWDDRLFVGDGTVPEAVDPTDWEAAADDWFRADVASHLRTALGETVPERRAWAGLCTATPDGDPLVGERAPGVYVAAGFQGHGFMRAPALGERLAAEVLGEDGIEAYDPSRFDGDESFEIVEGMRLEK